MQIYNLLGILGTWCGLEGCGGGEGGGAAGRDVGCGRASRGGGRGWGMGVGG